MPVDFDKQQYWHDRFSSEKSFEWLLPSTEFICLLERSLARLSSEARILHLGSGTSDLQNHLRKIGFFNVTNVDYEPLAIDRGRQLELETFGDVQMKYAVQDATQLNLDEKFDLVIDKSTSDAISCAGEEQIRRMATGVHRCLAEGGEWICLSYSSSRFDIDGLPFDIEVLAKVPTLKSKVTDPDVFHWCYILRREGDRNTQVEIA